MRSNIRDRNILFSGQDNSCLSFIAEAVAKKLLPPRTRVFSTGLKEDKIDPKALQVLREIGINASTQDAKGLDVIPTHDIDLIVMLGKPGEAQPTVSPRAKVTTWDIPDPCREPTPDLEAFRRARDEINKRVGGLFLDYWRNVAGPYRNLRAGGRITGGQTEEKFFYRLFHDLDRNRLLKKINHPCFPYSVAPPLGALLGGEPGLAPEGAVGAFVPAAPCELLGLLAVPDPVHLLGVGHGSPFEAGAW